MFLTKEMVLLNICLFEKLFLAAHMFTLIQTHTDTHSPSAHPPKLRTETLKMSNELPTSLRLLWRKTWMETGEQDLKVWSEYYDKPRRTERRGKLKMDPAL